MDDATADKPRRAAARAGDNLKDVQKDIADLRQDMAQISAALQDLVLASKGGLGAALKAKGDQVADQAAALRDMMQAQAAALRETVQTQAGGLRDTVQTQAGQLRDTAGTEVEQLRGYVRETPLKSVAAVGVAGLLFGLLVGRR